ncbi:MAG: hypothetical protein KDA65_11640 [Planctomycetaceae bacterium]|nr:hypothetical protein [Planctomycetaceae bacterium]
MTTNSHTHIRQDRPSSGIRRPFGILAGCLLALIFCGSASEAADGSWMYRRSYFSHAPDPYSEIQYPQPVSQSAYRPAYHGVHPGFAVKSGYRINRIQFQTGSGGFDTTIQYEGWNMMYGPRYKP